MDNSLLRDFRFRELSDQNFGEVGMFILDTGMIFECSDSSPFWVERKRNGDEVAIPSSRSSMR